MENFKELREKLINTDKIDYSYIQALGILEGLLEITEPIDAKPPIKKMEPGKEGEIYHSTDIHRKLGDKIVHIEFYEKIHHDHYMVEEAKMALLNSLKNPRPNSILTWLYFPRGGPSLPSIYNIDEGVLILQTYKRVIATNSYKARIGQK